MSDKKAVGKFAAMLGELKTFLSNNAIVTATNGSMKLRDSDTVLYWEGEEIIEGSTKMFTDEAMSTAAPEGDHVLEDGKMITLSADGTVVRVMAPENAAEARVKELEAENATLKADNDTLKASVDSLTEKHNKVIEEVNNKLEEMQKLGLGKDIKIVNVVRKPEERTEAVLSPMAAQFQKWVSKKKTL